MEASAAAPFDAVASAPPPAVAPPAPAPAPAQTTPKSNLLERKMRAHSTPLVVLGVVALSASAVTLYGTYVSVLVRTTCGYHSDSDSTCDEADQLAVGLGLASLGLIATGIPLIVVGSKRVPDEAAPETALRAPKRVEAEVVPFVTPERAGLRLRLAF